MTTSVPYFNLELYIHTCTYCSLSDEKNIDRNFQKNNNLKKKNAFPTTTLNVICCLSCFTEHVCMYSVSQVTQRHQVRQVVREHVYMNYSTLVTVNPCLDAADQ